MSTPPGPDNQGPDNQGPGRPETPRPPYGSQAPQTGAQPGQPGGYPGPQSGPYPAQPPYPNPAQPGGEPTQQLGAYGEQPPAQGGYYPPPGPDAQAWNQGPGQGQPPFPANKNKKPLIIGIAAVVVLALVAGGLFFFLSGDKVTYAGRTITDPDKVLTSAEKNVAAIVKDRNGAKADDTKCYFMAKKADESDIDNTLVCGPTLFVDGDAAKQYLSFPLKAGGGSGDATLTVATKPVSPEPGALVDRKLLIRPDGATPPSGDGGLKVPEPPQAEAGTLVAVDPEGIDLKTAPETAVIGGKDATVTLTGFGTPARYGKADDARRAAKGEKLVAFTLETGPGAASNGDPSAAKLAVQVDSDAPKDLPADAAAGSAYVLSVPNDAKAVTLVVSDSDSTQKMSVLDGTTDPGNILVLARKNLSQTVSAVQDIPATVSNTAGQSAPLTINASVSTVQLQYFAGPDDTKKPTSPGNAFLVIDANFTAPGVAGGGGFPPGVFTVTTPAGFTGTGVDLNDDPGFIQVGVEVPGDFTTGTLTIGGAATDADITITFGGSFAIPLSIPAG